MVRAPRDILTVSLNERAAAVPQDEQSPIIAQTAGDVECSRM